MTFLDKLKERIDDVNSLRASIKSALQVVPEEVRTERLSICNSCEFLFAPTAQCKKCGCFLKAKTAFAQFKCPIDKWPAEEK
jgi:hypothetical protein